MTDRRIKELQRDNKGAPNDVVPVVLDKGNAAIFTDMGTPNGPEGYEAYCAQFRDELRPRDDGNRVTSDVQGPVVPKSAFAVYAGRGISIKADPGFEPGNPADLERYRGTTQTHEEVMHRIEDSRPWTPRVG